MPRWPPPSSPAAARINHDASVINLLRQASLTRDLAPLAVYPAAAANEASQVLTTGMFRG